MKRFITDDLLKWKNSKYRKPLILKGARQVGKTYIVKKFAEDYYDDLAYFNFDHDEDLKNLFQNSKEPKRILEQLSFIHGKAIKEEKTLIFFDEIQECPDALNSLKYFQEEADKYHIIAAGSLLGIRLSHTSFPVGKVDYLDLKPMSFSEFLIADGEENLFDYMNNINEIENIPDIFFNKLNEKLKAYFIIGGMPEVVKSWVNDKDIERVNQLQKAILESYESDFSKHTTDSEANKISLIWNSISSQLSKENKKFLYQTVREGARAREYENALNWLNSANLIYKVYNVKKTKLPLNAYIDLSCFKIYMNDVGLLRKMSNLDSIIIKKGNLLYEEFKGSLTENFIFNQLINNFEIIPNYYTFNNYEIDFLIQNKNQILPIEVKSGMSTNNKSLTKYGELEKPIIMIRFSLNNLSKDGNILNVPLFMVEYLDKLLELLDK